MGMFSITPSKSLRWEIIYNFNVYISVFITFDILEANFNSKFRVFRLFIIMLEKGMKRNVDSTMDAHQGRPL